jgi:hypothetical protein
MQIVSETPQANASAMLKAEAPKTWRRRYGAADASGAVRSAAKSAVEHGKPVYVVASNSYGRFSWVVTLDARDVVSRIVNSGRRAFRVTPDLDVISLKVA